MTIIVFADCVGVTKAVWPFTNYDAARKWAMEFLDLFQQRFGESQAEPYWQIYEINKSEAAKTPAEFLEQLPNQLNADQFYFDDLKI